MDLSDERVAAQVERVAEEAAKAAVEFGEEWNRLHPERGLTIRTNEVEFLHHVTRDTLRRWVELECTPCQREHVAALLAVMAQLLAEEQGAAACGVRRAIGKMPGVAGEPELDLEASEWRVLMRDGSRVATKARLPLDVPQLGQAESEGGATR